jgi:hypothetical protein
MRRQAAGRPPHTGTFFSWGMSPPFVFFMKKIRQNMSFFLQGLTKRLFWGMVMLKKAG